MPHCVASGCINKSNNVRKEDGITFHRFPKNEALRDKWVAAVKREGWVPSNHSHLCSAHFTEEGFDRTSLSCVRLRQDVVPTVFPSSPAHLKKGAKKRKQPEERVETLQPIKITCTPDHPLSQIDNISLMGVEDNVIYTSTLPVPTETSETQKRKPPEERVVTLLPIKITCTPDHPLSQIDNISLTKVYDKMVYPSPLPVSTETSETQKRKQSEDEEETLQPIKITCTPDHPSPINLSFTGVDDDTDCPLPVPTESLEAQVNKLQQVVTKQRRKIRTLQQSKLRMQKIIAKMKTIIETLKPQFNMDIEHCD